MQKRTALALVLALAAGLASAQAPDWKKIRIGVEPSYPPFAEIGPDGKMKGFEIDLANAYCALLKAQCEFVQLEFDGMIPALQTRKIDAVMASMAITDERKRVIAFSEPYYATPARFIGRANAALELTPAGLKGKKIGVQRATTHERFVRDTFKQSEIVSYATQDQIFLDIKAGRVDVALADMAVSDQGFLKRPEGKGFAFVGPSFTDVKYFGRGTGVGMRRADEATLGAKVNATIKAHRDSGAFKALAAKYFDYDITAK